MPDYKHRRIELAPRRRGDETWYCPFRIIEFRPTSWGCYSGCADGRFESREEAEAAALVVAKRIVASLEPSPQIPQSEAGSLGPIYGTWMSRLAFYFLHRVENLGKSRG